MTNTVPDPAALMAQAARLRATAFHKAGVTLLGQGRLDESVAALRAAVGEDPGFAEAHFTLGSVLLQSGQPAPAASAYRSAIALLPGIAESWLGLGYAVRAQGQWAAVATACGAAAVLSPGLGAAYEPLAQAMDMLGRREETVAAGRTALLFQPDAPALQYGLGKALFELGREPDALEAFGRAVRLHPDWAVAHGALGTVLLQLGRPADAVAACTAAVGRQPDLASAHATLADALKGLDRPEDAVASYRRAVALAPAHVPSYTHLGDTLVPLGRSAEAAAVCTAAVTLAPALAAPHNNLGNALKVLGRVEEAAACYAAARARAPEEPFIRLNHALALLTLGRFAEGWEAYEARWRTGMVRVRSFAQPQWAGEDLAGRTILLHAEQGMGDTLHFARYAPLVAARDGRVVLEVQKPLLRLMRSLPGVERVVAYGEPLPEFDLHCPLMGLPRAFATRLDSIPNGVPYLHADPAQADAWRARLPADGTLRVGLVWAGEARRDVPHANRIDRQRSLSLEQLAPLAGIRGVRFVSLQKGPPAEQLRAPPPGLEVIDRMGEVDDFADTAALVANLDLVIGVDTSVIHLAGALGRPVWVLSRFDGCWRWLGGRDDTPWYPTMRLYRQERPGDWDPVIARLAADLRVHATAHMRR